jgi:hypothetical protein
MSALFGRLAGLFAYLCVATLIAQASAVVYMRATNRLDNDKIAKVVDALRGVEPPPPAETAKPDEEDPSLKEEPSLDEREANRDLVTRDLELREQSVKSGIDRMLYEKNALTQEKERYELIKRTFEEQLAAMREGALSSGRESVRLIWENIKPKQAKEQILRMLGDNQIGEVVTILTAMPIDKRAEIVSEFKAPDEVDKLDEILQQILEGVPEVGLIDETNQQVKPQAASSSPKKL